MGNDIEYKNVNYFLECKNYFPFPKYKDKIIGNYRFLTKYNKSKTAHFFIEYLGNKKINKKIEEYTEDSFYFVMSDEEHEFVQKQTEKNKKLIYVGDYNDYIFDNFTFDDFFNGKVFFSYGGFKAYGLGYVEEVKSLENKLIKDEYIFNDLKRKYASIIKEEIDKKEKVYYSINVNKTYNSLVDLKDRCEVLIDGIKDTKNGYTIKDYNAFFKSLSELTKQTVSTSVNNKKLINGKKINSVKGFLKHFAKK